LTACGQKVNNEDMNLITEEEAKKKVVDHAGLDEAEVTFTRLKPKTKDDRQVYEVEFYHDDKEYDYELDAGTGEIIGYDHEIENRTGQNGQEDTQTTNTDIGEDKAREIIMEQAPEAAQSDIVIRRDTNDGAVVYKGTVAYGEKNYEFTIDAVNGSITKWEEE